MAGQGDHLFGSGGTVGCYSDAAARRMAVGPCQPAAELHQTLSRRPSLNISAQGKCCWQLLTPRRRPVLNSQSGPSYLMTFENGKLALQLKRLLGRPRHRCRRNKWLVFYFEK
jgi:hypothetical protein